MRNDDTGHPLSLQAFEQVQKIFTVALIKRGRRLVQNEKLTVFAQRLGDLNKLLLADTDLVNGCFGIVGQAHTLHQRNGILVSQRPVHNIVTALNVA